jgi:hypothetical protein
MTNSTEILSIDINSLSVVTGGQGPLEAAGAQIGKTAGQLAQPFLPAPIRPVAPPVGQAVGGGIGAWADRQIGNLNPFRR